MAGLFNKTTTLLCVVMILTSSCHCRVSVKEKSFTKDGDLIIGGLLPLHHPKPFNAHECGGIRSITALKELEAMVYAINFIDNNDTILPGVHLGFDIRDTCFSESITLRSALNFIPAYRCNDSHQSIVGVVGARRSSSSVQAALLFSLFKIPQISYLSTSDVLSNKYRFPFFMRTVSPDVLQVAAIYDILLEFDWTYISFISSDDVYGQNGQKEFRLRSIGSPICTATYHTVSVFNDKTVFDKVIGELMELQEDTTSVVVVLFVDILLARRIFASADNMGAKRRFIWVGSDGWSNYGDLAIDGYEQVTAGKFKPNPKKIFLNIVNVILKYMIIIQRRLCVSCIYRTELVNSSPNQC